MLRIDAQRHHQVCWELAVQAAEARRGGSTDREWPLPIAARVLAEVGTARRGKKPRGERGDRAARKEWSGRRRPGDSRRPSDDGNEYGAVPSLAATDRKRTPARLARRKGGHRSPASCASANPPRRPPAAPPRRWHRPPRRRPIGPTDARPRPDNARRQRGANPSTLGVTPGDPWPAGVALRTHPAPSPTIGFERTRTPIVAGGPSPAPFVGQHPAEAPRIRFVDPRHGGDTAVEPTPGPVRARYQAVALEDPTSAVGTLVTEAGNPGAHPASPTPSDPRGTSPFPAGPFPTNWPAPISPGRRVVSSGAVDDRWRTPRPGRTRGSA